MKNFFDCKDEKITERAFSQGVFISVLSILLCLVALCSITYAWFTDGTSSNSNKLISGSFDITVSVIKTSEADGSVAMIASNDGSYKLSIGTYTVTLNPSDDATVKGYCIVTIDDTGYGTDVIVDSEMMDESYTEVTDPFTFTIVVDKPDTIVKLEPHWGVLVEPDVEDGATIVVKEGSVEIENTSVSD